MRAGIDDPAVELTSGSKAKAKAGEARPGEARKRLVPSKVILRRATKPWNQPRANSGPSINIYVIASIIFAL
jgi:hypothetical protein